MGCSDKQRRALAKARKKWKGMSHKKRKAAMPNPSHKSRKRKGSKRKR